MSKQYEETQYFHWSVISIFILVITFMFMFLISKMAYLVFIEKNYLIAVFLLGVIIVLGLLVPTFGKMITEIEDENLIIRLGKFKWIQFKIPLTQIISTEVVSYRPIMQFGGWGLMVGKFNDELTCSFTTQGNSGVLLALSEPYSLFKVIRVNKILVGSSTASSLSSSIGK